MWHMGGGWGWWMLFGWFWMVAFWGLVIWAVYALLSRFGGNDRPAPPWHEPSALEILDRRFARGEIDAEQFEEMRRRLTYPGAPAAKPA